jgi:acyl-CoA reductase-like NAD-dependent aldehyde dehydrogenase
MSERLDVLKTYKLFIGGAFPRSESGRSEALTDGAGRVVGHSCKASRKDLREAVVAARAGLAKWSGASAYNRGQVLYRAAEMLQSRRAEMVELLVQGGADVAHAGREVEAGVDRLVHFAGWTDKLSHVLGGANSVAGPYWNITVPQAVGVVGVVCPSQAPLLGLISLAAPVLCAGASCVVLSPAWVPVVSTLGEVLATSDLPGGACNILTGDLGELAPVLAGHRDVDAVVTCSGVGAQVVATLRAGSAENLKRVTVHAGGDWFDQQAWHTPALAEAALEHKTAWHPVGS